jgi:plastocyanin
MLVSWAEAVHKKSEKIPEYKVIKVINGRTISGKAVFSGSKVPKDEMLTITSNKKFCGDKIAARKYLINKDKEIKNVVVYLADITSGKDIPTQPVIIDNLKCAFEPHVSVGFIGKGNMTRNKNSDHIFHNVHAYIRGKTIYNLSIPEQGNEIKRRFFKTGIMSITCNVHPWMLGYVLVFNHPYAAVTNEKGEYSIPDVPAGTYELRAWHEGFGDISLGKRTVTPGKTMNVIAKFK